MRCITKVLFFLAIRRVDAQTLRNSVPCSQIDKIGSRVMSFRSIQRSHISRILVSKYSNFCEKGSSAFSERHIQCLELVEMVPKNAMDERLAVACGFCCDNKGTSMKIMLSICYGCYPAWKDEEDNYAWAWEVMKQLQIQVTFTMFQLALSPLMSYASGG